MKSRRLPFSICIPAYNRARFLPALLDSVYAQDFYDYEIVICEDGSPERAQIASVAREYAERYPGTLQYYENEVNLGYDANIRRLVEKASGEYCFFMGNDDIMCPEALSAVYAILLHHDNLGLVLKSYACFEDTPGAIKEEIRYFREERAFRPGRDAIMACFRRSGVISGYIVHRDTAQCVATDKFDGTLYYQLHLTSTVLSSRCAVFTPKILVLCRANEPPEFGSGKAEKEKFVPGRYTPEARLSMVSGALHIAEELRNNQGIDLVQEITRDYANYFYPYVKDQLDLPIRDYFRLYRNYGRMGFDKFPLFHAHCLVAYVLGARTYDSVINAVRNLLGRSLALQSTTGSVGS